MSGAMQQPRDGRVGGKLGDALFERYAKLGVLENQLYGHVLDAIDFEALYGLEQMLWCLLPELGFEDDEGGLATSLIDGALARAVMDPARYCDEGPPPGITEAEAKAVAFDENCPFCKAEADRPADGEHAHDEEPCALCDDMARMWREEHADVLQRKGLAR